MSDGTPVGGVGHTLKIMAVDLLWVLAIVTGAVLVAAAVLLVGVAAYSFGLPIAPFADHVGYWSRRFIMGFGYSIVLGVFGAVTYAWYLSAKRRADYA